MKTNSSIKKISKKSIIAAALAAVCVMSCAAADVTENEAEALEKTGPIIIETVDSLESLERNTEYAVVVQVAGRDLDNNIVSTLFMEKPEFNKKPVASKSEMEFDLSDIQIRIDGSKAKLKHVYKNDVAMVTFTVNADGTYTVTSFTVERQDYDDDDYYYEDTAAVDVPATEAPVVDSSEPVVAETTAQ